MALRKLQRSRLAGTRLKKTAVQKQLQKHNQYVYMVEVGNHRAVTHKQTHTHTQTHTK